MESSAVGGFVDIGDLVASSATGARFGMHLAWAIVLGAVGIILFADMTGRVAAESGRPVFDLVRERLGPTAGLLNIAASSFVNLLTLIAEVGGIALALELITSVNYVLWIPVCAVAVWLVIWRVKFESMECTFGVLGLAIIVASVAVWKLHPDWSALWHQSIDPSRPASETPASYFYWAIGLFASAMTPYEVIFFSSGAVEEHWSGSDLNEERANVFVGFHSVPSCHSH